MTDKKPILIRINDKTYKLNPNNLSSLKAMPWEARKELINLLEQVKQAEYVKPQKQPADDEPKSKHDASAVISTEVKRPETKPVIASKQQKPTLDKSVKPSDSDVDDIMNRLILEQKSTHQTVPDKSSVYKWFLILFIVIVLLAMLF